MIFEETISSIQDLLTCLENRFPSGERVWFRGQHNASWNLVPSLARAGDSSKRVVTETIYIKTFKQNALLFLPHPPQSEWEWLFLMRHYAVPTRLLDWSESALVGLYFATEEDVHRDDQDGALWCLRPSLLNMRANISPEVEAELPFFEVDEVLDNYRPDKVAQERQTELEPVAAGALRRFARLSAQLGVFTVTHRSKQTIEPGDHLAKILIPTARKPQIRSQLALLGITRLSLFPELESVGEVTKAVPR